MIAWFVDRFGLPGQYHRTWVRLMRDNYIPLNEVRVLSLHKIMNRQLLTKYMTRKAPTWIPEEELNITQVIDNVIRELKPRAVVLTAPESLACLGLAPEHATLHNLRGSVYWRSGVPHLVMLPMSAWFSMVSQKEIGAANYGFESQDAFAAGRQGQIPPTGEGAADIRNESGTGGETSSTPRGGNVVARGGQSTTAKLAPASADSAGSIRSQGMGEIRRGSYESAPTADSLARSRNRIFGKPDGGNRSHGVAEGSGESRFSGAIHDGHLQGESGWGDGDSASLDDEDRSAGGIRGDSEDDPRSLGEGGADDDLDSGESDSDDGVSATDGGSDNDGSSDSPDREDGEVDQFFYEPVLSPVGRFVLTADTQKLFRILRDGKNAAGPARPVEVNWR